jgi:mRNA export factor
VISGGADNAGRLYDLATGQSQQIAQHTEPIKSITYLDQNIVATGSWDKTIKYWDMRTPNPVGTITLGDRVYSMDSRGQLLVAGSADNMLAVVDLNNPTVVFRQDRSPLKNQIRKVACFTVGKGYAISSIEGRIGIQYVDQDKS